MIETFRFATGTDLSRNLILGFGRDQEFGSAEGGHTIDTSFEGVLLSAAVAIGCGRYGSATGKRYVHLPEFPFLLAKPVLLLAFSGTAQNHLTSITGKF